MMDGQVLFNIVIGACGAMGGWMLRIIFDSITALQKDVKDLNSEIHQDFLRKDDYRDDINDIKGMLNRIFAKLDQKADK